ncbi:glycosyltransferase family 2 protein [Bizionia sediminis]|uniref:Glycosyltransferase family 2 protein n=1 Tax=Bizionia sediminis TaxID=1737064 RepID=A0ABW5KR91_9FLAO
METKLVLLLTTYNWPEALELVLMSIKNQTVLPYQVIVADDGSTEETRRLIQTYQENFPVPLIHIWHEDKGFRRSAILNLAISKTTADYIVQIDGDCIIDKNFIKNHKNSLEKKTYLFGSRVSIKADFLSELFNKKIVSFSYFSKGIKKRNRTIYMPFLGSILYRKNNELSKKLRGCNLSYWRSDFIEINGYNEDMTGWGREDSELITRMMNKGVQGKRLKFQAILYHIWHKESSKSNLNINHEIQEKAKKENLISCKNGINKYLND